MHNQTLVGLLDFINFLLQLGDFIHLPLVLGRPTTLQGAFVGILPMQEGLQRTTVLELLEELLRVIVHHGSTATVGFRHLTDEGKQLVEALQNVLGLSL